MTTNRTSGLTLVESLIVIVIIGILIGMLLPAVTRSSGEAARRTMCMNNLRQLGLAAHHYESANMRFPSCTGLEIDNGGSASLSGFVALLPYLELNDSYEDISAPAEFDGTQFPAWPDSWVENYPPYQQSISSFLCPSSPAASDEPRIHYGMSIGDRARNINQPTLLRGGFAGTLTATLPDISDGTSNTLLMAEMSAANNFYAINQPATLLENPAHALRLAQMNSDVALSGQVRGYAWADGRAGPALVNTVLPPNSPSAAVGGEVAVDGFYSVASAHPGGANHVFFDGSCHFIDEEIDAGDASHPSLTEDKMQPGMASPYGVWGAMGTIAGEEEVRRDW